MHHRIGAAEAPAPAVFSIIGRQRGSADKGATERLEARDAEQYVLGSLRSRAI